MSFIKWCNDNQGFISALLSVLSILLAFISLLISLKISQRQRKTDHILALRQEDLQKRQIKLDTYSYRLACYEALYSLKQFTESARKKLKEHDIKTRTLSEKQEIISNIYEITDISSSEIMLRLKEGEFVFQTSVWNNLEKIGSCYNRMCHNIPIITSSHEDYLSEEHKQSVEEKINEILKDLKHLDELLYYTIPAVEPDLVLSDLHLYPGIYIK